MPSSLLGQMITFAIQVDFDPSPDLPAYVMVNTHEGDTIQALVSRLGHPENARAVANLNGIRSVTQVINNTPWRAGDKNVVRVPARLRPPQELSVLAGQEPPKITGGYAKFQNIDRYGRTGINQFMGYDPLVLNVPIVFEAQSRDFTSVQATSYSNIDVLGRVLNIRQAELKRAQEARIDALEADCELLERMAGRGAYVGSGIGPPPVIRASTTDNQGNVVGLIPVSYQWSQDNPGLLWRITGLDWHDGAMRNPAGFRIRAEATVTLTEHTHSSLVSQSAAQRAKVS